MGIYGMLLQKTSRKFNSDFRIPSDVLQCQNHLNGLTAVRPEA